MGARYILDHCLGAYMQELEEKQYRVYVTDGLKAVAENTAKFAGGTYLSRRWIEYIDADQEHDPDEGRDGVEVAQERLERMGITIT